MRLPNRLLQQIRAPLLAVAVAGCSTATAATPATPAVGPIAEAMTDEAIVPVAAIDPVAYDPVAYDPVAYDMGTERDRLQRLDQENAAREHRRDERIAEEQARHRTVRAQVPAASFPYDVYALCGRG